MMSYAQAIRAASTDAEKLEQVYQDALEADETEDFKAAIDTGYAEEPENLLYAAWYYRLIAMAQSTETRRVVVWTLAVPLALVNGLLFWWLSDPERYVLEITGRSSVPYILLLWAPIAGVFVLAYLVGAGRRSWISLALATAVLAALAVYPLILYQRLDTAIEQEHYLMLNFFTLPLVAWSAVGFVLLYSSAAAEDTFAFLIKSLEVIITGGLFAIALGLFTGIAFSMFDALGVATSELVQRLFIAGGGGLIPVLAVAITYDSRLRPADQSFTTGLSKLIATLMRVLLPLTLIFLVVYVVLIPFNFWRPFEDRDVLIIYNAMLFAVMALLVGATPVTLVDMEATQRRWLRSGLVGLAGLTALVSIYALSAISYRTMQEGLTPNRLIFIGWNVINTGILLLLLFRQLSTRGDAWLGAFKATFRIGAVAYVVWSVFTVLAPVWIF